jgi:hypothetical protein
MIDTIRIFTAVALIVGTGLIYGAWTNRWGPSPALTALAGRFESVPMVIGDWKGEAFELAPEERAMAGAVACLARRYINSTRGVSVSVLLLGGLPGLISTHTPDACYPGAGYSLDSSSPIKLPYGPERRQTEFRTALARRTGTNPSVLRIIWGWNASAGWKAPDEPRWEFGSASTLCKLFVVRETMGVAVAPERDPCGEFIDVFLPELDRCVFSARG